MSQLPALNWSRARWADAAAMLAIYNEAVARVGQLPMVQPASIESIQMTLRHSNRLGCPVWAYWHEDQIVGWSQIRPLNWGGACTQKTGELSIYVGEAWHGRGVAAQAVFMAFAQSVRLGYQAMTCWILGVNQKSRQLARACRMNRWGLLPLAACHGDQRFDIEIWGCLLDDPNWRQHMERIQRRLSGRTTGWMQERVAISTVTPSSLSQPG